MICPPNLHANKLAELENLILSAYRGLRCKGLARVDVIQDMSGDFFLLELNTIPGMTNHSFVPSAMKAVGIDYDGMLVKILKNEVESIKNET